MIDTALAQLDFSYAPYSGFNVGAALLAKNQAVYTGCNIENAAYTPTNCAERTAFFKAVSEGVRDFEAICIVGGRNQKPTGYTAPCGVCRQVMMEFCNPKTFKIMLAIDREIIGFTHLRICFRRGSDLRTLSRAICSCTFNGLHKGL